MYTKADVLSAYFAHQCELFAQVEEIMAEQIAIADFSKSKHKSELDKLERGREFLKILNLVIGHRQTGGTVTLISADAETVLVPAGYIATQEVFRQVTLVSDITYLTPSEVAEMTGEHKSGWRNKAAAGKIPGAIKKGKQWLIPASAISGKDTR